MINSIAARLPEVQFNLSTHENQTNAFAPKIWGLDSLFTLGICLTGILTNGGLIFLFALDRSLRTPFSPYIINLMLVNLLRLAVQHPLDIIVERDPRQAWPFARPLCTTFLYFKYILGSGAVNCHALIAINRTWAILNPMGYRAVHSTKFAVFSCLAMWIYVHLLCGPYFLVERTIFAFPTDNHRCMQNVKALPTWTIVNSFLASVLPLTVVLLSYPIVLVKHFLWEKKHRTLRRNPTVIYSTNQVSDVSRGILQVYKEERSRTATQERDVASQRKRLEEKQKRRLLGVMTISVGCLYTPTFIYFILTGFIRNFWNLTFYQVSYMLFQCQSTWDPVLFVLAVGQLQTGVRQFFDRLCRTVHACFEILVSNIFSVA